MIFGTLHPRYNAVIGRHRPYRIIMRTALYWNEQQRRLSFSQPHSVDSDMPKSRGALASLSPFSMHSTAFTLSLTVHAFHLQLKMMLCYSTNDCCSGRAVVPL